MDWFTVDKAGLARLLDRHGKGFVVAELLQNAWDEDVSRVDATLTPVPGRPLVELSVTDDSPDGFRDLSHAYTLFAPSAKIDDAEKRGRFNLGEKLVLAICEEATIRTTTGTVHFNHDGRHANRIRTQAGTEFHAVLRMTPSRSARR